MLYIDRYSLSIQGPAWIQESGIYTRLSRTNRKIIVRKRLHMPQEIATPNKHLLPLLTINIVFLAASISFEMSVRLNVGMSSPERGMVGVVSTWCQCMRSSPICLRPNN